MEIGLQQKALNANKNRYQKMDIVAKGSKFRFLANFAVNVTTTEQKS